MIDESVHVDVFGCVVDLIVEVNDVDYEEEKNKEVESWEKKNEEIVKVESFECNDACSVCVRHFFKDVIFQNHDVLYAVFDERHDDCTDH